MNIRGNPCLVEVFESPKKLRMLKNAVLICGNNEEERQSWYSHVSVDERIEILGDDGNSFEAIIKRQKKSYRLRAAKDLKEFFFEVKALRIFLDLTSLPHHIWAPLLRASINERLNVEVTYVEPEDYKILSEGDQGLVFDLSERISGIAPIPGFLTLTDDNEDQFCLVALLGFEGPRFAHVVEVVDPPGGKIYPVIGMPGFRIEYPQHAFYCNRITLRDTKAWKNVRYADASDPFSLCYVLEAIAQENPGVLLKVAPIGTKPHALGAFLFFLKARRQVEFIYDHPIRKRERSEGVGKLHIYHASKFLDI